MAKFTISGDSFHELLAALGRVFEEEIWRAKRANAPIGALHLMARTENALRAYGIESVEQLMDKESQVRFIPNIGKIGVADIKRSLSEWRAVNG